MKIAYAIAIAIIFSSNSLLYAAPYEFTAVPMPAGATSAGYPAINQSHEIALSFYFPDPADPTGNPLGHAYAGTFGNLMPLLLPANSDNAIARSINDSGEIVGYTNDSNGIAHPVLWNNGTVTTLSTGTMTSGVAFSINNSGQIAGEISPGGTSITSNAAVWDGTTLSDLGNYGATQTAAIAINNQGQTLITAYNFDTSQETSILHDQTSDVMLAPLGSRGTFAKAINNLGQIANESPDNRTYIWNNGVYTLLDALLNESADFPVAMNNTGGVVGAASIVNGGLDAIMWQGTSVIDLNSLLPADSGWQLQIASGITDDGTIVGIGLHDGQTQAFVLTPTTSGSPSIPIPEPTSLALLALAIPFLLPHRRQPSTNP